MKTKICMWCGGEHKIWSNADETLLPYYPEDCKNKDRLMTEACKVAETWVVMRMIENLGSDSLYSWKGHIEQFSHGSRD